MRHAKHAQLTVILWLLIIQLTALALPEKPNNLYLIKKIHIGERKLDREIQDEEGLSANRQVISREKLMNSYLEQELVKAGFEVVKDREQADAVLSGAQGITIVEDGPQLNPPKHDYSYHLTPPGVENLWESKDALWMAEISVRSKLDVSEVDRIAATKLVKKLLKDWLKSARKAGLNIKDQVQ